MIHKGPGTQPGSQAAYLAIIMPVTAISIILAAIVGLIAIIFMA